MTPQCFIHSAVRSGAAQDEADVRANVVGRACESDNPDHDRRCGGVSVDHAGQMTMPCHMEDQRDPNVAHLGNAGYLTGVVNNEPVLTTSVASTLTGTSPMLTPS